LEVLTDEDDPKVVRENLLEALDKVFATEEYLVDILRHDRSFQRLLPRDTSSNFDRFLPSDSYPEGRPSNINEATREVLQRQRTGQKIAREIRTEYVYRAYEIINRSYRLTVQGRIVRPIDEETRLEIRMKHLKESAECVRVFERVEELLGV
jgi:hypothetical protein